MNLSDCEFLDNKEISGLNLIMRKIPPFNIGRPLRFDTERDEELFLKKYNLLEKCAISSEYRIIIVWFGTIENISSVVPSGEHVTIRQFDDLKIMMEYYERERIKGNETRLKKHLRK